MIKDKSSYRSTITNPQLTSPKKLNIMDRCQEKGYIPSPKALFNLFEKSYAMKRNTASSEPLMPYECEIQAFESNKSIDHAKIRKASRIIAQGQSHSSCLFFKLPTEVNIKIAGFTGNQLIHDEISATQIAATNYGKP